MRKAKTWFPFPQIRRGPLQALTNAETKLAKGFAVHLSLLLSSSQGRIDT